MKSIRCLILFGVTAGLALPVLQAADTPASTPPPAAAGVADLSALERFLALSDAELVQMADAIARVRAMTPAQRVALREQIVAFRQLPEAQRTQLRQGWGAMPPEIQNGWREMMQAATEAEHAEIQRKLQVMSPEERMRFRRGLVEAYLKAKAERK